MEMTNYEELADKIETLDRRAKLEQIAEESAELGKACLKLIRAMGNGNPCTITQGEATKEFIEEYCDVVLTSEILMRELYTECDYDVYEYFKEMADKKIKRWKERLEKANEKA